MLEHAAVLSYQWCPSSSAVDPRSWQPGAKGGGFLPELLALCDEMCGVVKQGACHNSPLTAVSGRTVLSVMGVPGGGGEGWRCFSASCSYLGDELGVYGRL